MNRVRMTAERTQAALDAISNAAAASINLVNLVDLGFPSDAEEALVNLLHAAADAFVAAGFDPDEAERGQLYRAIVEYVGEEGDGR